MSKFKTWLYNKFLPAYCRDDLMETKLAMCTAVVVQSLSVANEVLQTQEFAD